MTVNQIIIDYLKTNSFEGLCNDDCGCGLEDLAPCDEMKPECTPAYKCKCAAEGKCEHGHLGCYLEHKTDKCWMEE